jgi:hypothetical protein
MHSFSQSTARTSLMTSVITHALWHTHQLTPRTSPIRTFTNARNSGQVLAEQGKIGEALTLFGEFLPLMQRVLGPEHYLVLHASMQFGASLANCGKLVRVKPMPFRENTVVVVVVVVVVCVVVVVVVVCVVVVVVPATHTDPHTRTHTHTHTHTHT